MDMLKNYEVKFRKKDGTLIDCLITSSVWRSDNGTILGYQGILHDITERKRMEEALRSSREELRNLTLHMETVREEERSSLGREVHDELGQALTALKMDVSWLSNRLLKDQVHLLEKTKSMSKLIDVTIQTVQKISTKLRPRLLDDLGLAAAIEWQAEEFQKRTGIECEVEIDHEYLTLETDISTAIFRIFQETLTNIACHANATQAKVSLKEKAGKLMMRVRDNGKGITKKEIFHPRSFGLIGIRERARVFGGKVTIQGTPGRGSTVTVSIPLQKAGKSQ